MTSKNAGNKDPLTSFETTSGATAKAATFSPEQSMPNISVTDERIEAILRENEQLKKRLRHVDNLGRMVADYKESNTNLAKENSDLKDTVDELLRSQMKRHQQSAAARMSSSHRSDENSSSDGENSERENTGTDDGFEVVEPNEGSTSPRSTRCVITTSPVSADSHPLALPQDRSAHTGDSVSISQDIPVLGEVESSGSFRIASESPPAQTFSGEAATSRADEQITSPNATALEAAAAAAFCERQANSIPSLTQEINVFNEVIKSDSPVTNSEIRQLENIGGLEQATSANQDHEIDDIFASMEDSESKSNGSVTAQFAKLAGVFARLAQRVMQTQKKAKNSQAFCNALLMENDKLKQDLSEEKKKTLESQKTLEEKEREIKQITKSMRKKEVATSSRRSNSTTDEPLTKESAENMPSDVAISDTNLQNYIEKLHNRIKKLENQRTEILRVNKQWHSQYNKLKEECNSKISSSKTEMAELKEEITGKQEENAKRKRDIDLLLKEAKKEIDVLQRQKGDLAKSYALEHSKAQKLNEKILKLKSDMSGTQAENQRLNQALEAAYSIRQSRQLSVANSLYEAQSSVPTESEEISSRPFGNIVIPSETVAISEQSDHQQVIPHEINELKTQAEVLQQQVKIYREDFETERRDREKSQAEKDRLNSEMSRMKDEMRALNQQVRAYEQDFRQERREKQRLQRQLSRLQMGTGTVGNNIAPALYYDLDMQDTDMRRQTSPSRDRLRYVQPREEIVIQTATAGPVQSSRRYIDRTGTHPPPPYTHDTPRHRRRTAAGITTTRRMRDEYLEPRGYDHDPEVVYPPDHVLNQY